MNMGTPNYRYFYFSRLMQRTVIYDGEHLRVCVVNLDIFRSAVKWQENKVPFFPCLYFIKDYKKLTFGWCRM